MWRAEQNSPGSCALSCPGTLDLGHDDDKGDDDVRERGIPERMSRTSLGAMVGPGPLADAIVVLLFPRRPALPSSGGIGSVGPGEKLPKPCAAEVLPSRRSIRAAANTHHEVLPSSGLSEASFDGVGSSTRTPRARLQGLKHSRSWENPSHALALSQAKRRVSSSASTHSSS